MVFDSSQPKDTTKLRLLGDVIRPNWEAIEEGDETFKPKAINLIKGSDPSSIADTFRLYSKDDGSGGTELFGVNAGGEKTGGLILSWGSGSFTSGAEISPTGVSTIFQVVLTIDDSSATPGSRAYVYGLNSPAGTFKAKVVSGIAVLRYMVIGV